jgi:hypothetical protein
MDVLPHIVCFFTLHGMFGMLCLGSFVVLSISRINIACAVVSSVGFNKCCMFVDI